MKKICPACLKPMPGQDLLYRIGNRDLAAHQTDAVFFCLLGHVDALHASRGKGRASYSRSRTRDTSNKSKKPGFTT